MTAPGAATSPAKREPMTDDRTDEIMAKLAVMTADIIDLDDRLSRLDQKHRDHTSGGGQ
jgi:hypothetical protein